MWKLTVYFVLIGGIIGLGEAEEDRVGLLHTLATLPSHPESVPINALIAVKGTPLEEQKVFVILLDVFLCFFISNRCSHSTSSRSCIILLFC